MNQYHLGQATIVTPDPWKDITETVESNRPPLTFAKDDGVGALQFSIAEYRAGKHPEFTLSSLRNLLISFSEKNGLRNEFERFERTEETLISAASFQMEGDYIRVWYCSKGADVILGTLTAVWNTQGNEPLECDEIVESIRFKKVPLVSDPVE